MIHPAADRVTSRVTNMIRQEMLPDVIIQYSNQGAAPRTSRKPRKVQQEQKKDRNITGRAVKDVDCCQPVKEPVDDVIFQ